jgi:hypothetical protein
VVTDKETEDRAQQTYRYVRIVVVLPAVWLIVAILVTSIAHPPVNDSISDYYGGPIRDIFVGGLMACGICMVAYKGRSKLEDWALNFAGANAFLVALVPNSFTDLLKEAQAAETTSTPPPVSSHDLVTNLRVSVFLYLGVVLAFVLIDRYLVKRWTGFHVREQTMPANALIAVSWVGEALLVVAVVALVADYRTILGASVFTIVHFAAAGLLVVNLSFAAASCAFDGLYKSGKAPLGPHRILKTVTFAMLLGIVGGGICILCGVDYSILVTELWEIVFFLIFWISATSIEWTLPPRVTSLFRRPGDEVSATRDPPAPSRRSA